MEDFACQVAFEASDDFGLGLAFVGSTLDVFLGSCAVAHPDDDCDVQRGVGLSVSSSVQTVAVGLAAAGGDGSDTAEAGEGGL